MLVRDELLAWTEQKRMSKDTQRVVSVRVAHVRLTGLVRLPSLVTRDHPRFPPVVLALHLYRALRSALPQLAKDSNERFQCKIPRILLTLCFPREGRELEKKIATARAYISRDLHHRAIDASAWLNHW